MMQLLMVGCGKMGSAMLAGWRRAHHDGITFTVIKPTEPAANREQLTWYSKPEQIPRDYVPDVIMLAVKPQQLDEVLPFYAKRYASANVLYLSIAAGKTLGYFRQHLGEKAQVARAMPNTPALTGKGMSLLCAPSSLPETARYHATMLMEAIGKVALVDDESLMDAAAAISGCGPAYIYYFIECLVTAGKQAGLDETLARTLAIETLYGSAALAAQSHDNIEQLRKNVTSKGGMTEAALAVLMQDNALEKLLTEAVKAAKTRAEQLK
jgi:pyrroline-5-carboxylate reductase